VSALGKGEAIRLAGALITFFGLLAAAAWVF
jgi:hypothetical protein